MYPISRRVMGRMSLNGVLPADMGIEVGSCHVGGDALQQLWGMKEEDGVMETGRTWGRVSLLGLHIKEKLLSVRRFHDIR